MRAAAEGHPTKGVALVLSPLWAKAQGIKLTGLIPILRHVMGVYRIGHHHGTRWHEVTLIFKGFITELRQGRQWRIHTQRFLDHPIGFHHLV